MARRIVEPATKSAVATKVNSESISAQVNRALETAPVFGDKMHVSFSCGNERRSQPILATTIEIARNGIWQFLEQNQGWQLAY
jgi:hypothetical protein